MQSLIWIIGCAALLWIGCFIWHFLENKKLIRQLIANQIDVKIIKRLMFFTWNRTLQLLLVLLGGAVLITAYDISLQDKHIKLIASEAEVLALQSRITVAEESNPEKLNELAPASTSPVTDAMIVRSLFEEEEPKNTKQAQMDQIKRRYEDLFISYLFLKKCSLERADDYHIINSSLLQDMASINAPSRMQYDILTAAKGSFQEMYSATPCNQSGVEDLSRNYQSHIQLLGERAQK